MFRIFDDDLSFFGRPGPGQPGQKTTRLSPRVERTIADWIRLHVTSQRRDRLSPSPSPHRNETPDEKEARERFITEHISF